MDIKTILFVLLATQLFQSCGECKPDRYGEFLQLVMPVTTSPAKDTFAIGDTLTIEANFVKDIEIYNTTNTIKLDSFKFFTQFGVADITDTFENFNVLIDTIVEVGQVGYLPLQGAIAYPINFLEDEGGYHLKFKVILKSKGMFWLFFSSAEFFYEEPNYDHPALYTCDNNRRDRVIVFFKNSNTTLKAYQDIFLKTKVDYLLQSWDFERYSNLGSISIIVQ